MQYRLLRPDSERDIHDLQKALLTASGYYLVVEGRAPGPAAARDVLQEAPSGKSLDDKYVFGIEQAGRLIGCFDLVKGYPERETAFIGLLLFVESEQGKSHGVAALRYIERLAGDWGCARLRIAVVATNGRAVSFWKREGFIELYRKTSDRYTGDVIVMERILARDY